MLSTEEKTDIAFAGSAEEQRIASQVFAVMRAQGRFMSSDAPIRVSLESARAFLEQSEGEKAAGRIERVLEVNAAIFSLSEVDGQAVIETTRAGRAPRQASVDQTHSFDRRFMTPIPKPVVPERPVRERPRVDPSWATLDQLLAPLGAEEFDLELTPVEETPPPAVVEATVPEVVEVEEEPPVEIEIVPARTITVPAAPPSDV